MTVSVAPSRLDTAATRVGVRFAGLRPCSRSHTAFRCSLVVPQQPPTMLTPKSLTKRSSQSASPAGSSGKYASSPRVSGSPALGSTLINFGEYWAKCFRLEIIRSGPTAQFIPITSISSKHSSVVNAPAMSVPGSIFWSACMMVTWTINGTFTPRFFISSTATMVTILACKMSKQVSIRIASTPSSSMTAICGR